MKIEDFIILNPKFLYVTGWVMWFLAALVLFNAVMGGWVVPWLNETPPPDYNRFEKLMDAFPFWYAGSLHFILFKMQAERKVNA